jgi:hypothetical protein
VRGLVAVSEIRLQARYNGNHICIARVQRGMSGISQDYVESQIILKLSSSNYGYPRVHLIFDENVETGI